MAYGEADKAKPKGDAGLLIALGGPEKPSAGGSLPMGDAESDEPGMGDVKEMAVNDMFDAVKSGDRNMFADGMDRYVKACMGEV